MAIEEEYYASVGIFALTFLMVMFLRNYNNLAAFNIPQSPPTIPFFGNALSLKENDQFLNQLIAFSKEYGQVFSLYIGRKLVVIVNGWEEIKEVTIKTGLDFADRSESVAILQFNPKRIGM